MSKSTLKLSIVHQLSRTGGTLFAKIIGNDDNIILLSEVHPSRNGEDIRRQCIRNYSIAVPKSLTSYLECLTFLAENRQENIIVRDFSHRDFLRKNSKLQITSAELLKERFELGRISLARHPADQFLSMMNFKPIARYMTFERFCKGYTSYHNNIPLRGIIRYEDFVKSPGRLIKETSRFLNIDLREDMIDNFHRNKKVTGDLLRNGSRGFFLRKVTKMSQREGCDDVCKLLRKNKQMIEICERLQYEI